MSAAEVINALTLAIDGVRSAVYVLAAVVALHACAGLARPLLKRKRR